MFFKRLFAGHSPYDPKDLLSVSACTVPGSLISDSQLALADAKH